MRYAHPSLRTTIITLAALAALVFGLAQRASAGGDALQPSAVVSVMSSRRGPIRKKCWDESPDKTGASMKIDFTIAPSGVVTDLAAHETSGPASIVACVSAEVQKTVFPASGAGGRFRWPFIFKGP